MVTTSAQASNAAPRTARQRQVWHWLRSGHRSVFGVLLVAFLGARFVLGRSGEPMVFFDTTAYAQSPDGNDHLVSFAGNAPRLWGTPAFYALFPDDPSRVLAQFAVSTIAWVLLAWALWRSFDRLAARLFAASAVMLISLCSAVASWEFAVLSESLSISLGILTLACFLLWHRTGSTIALIATTTAAFWWAFTRAEIRIYLVLLCVGLAYFIVKDRQRRRAALISTLTLLVALAWASAISPRTEKYFPRYSATGLSLQEETFIFRVIHRIYPNPSVLESYRHDLGMPSCPAVDQAVANNTNGIGGIEHLRSVARAYETCPDLVAWVKETSGTFNISMLAQRPRLYFNATTSVLPDIFTTGDFRYGKVTPLLPERAEKVIFPPRKYSISFTFGTLLLAGVFALVTGAWRRRRSLFVIVLYTMAVQLASQAAVLMYVSSELPRYGIQENTILRVCMIMFVALGIDALLSRRAVLAPDRELP